MRYRTLDSLRGIAALAVVFHHCLMTFPESFRNEGVGLSQAAWARPWTWFRISPLWAFVCGRPAVILFFVLSGFVLALPFIDGSAPSYGRYLTKRFFRLYPPFAAVILVSALMETLIAPGWVQSASRWFNQESWSAPVTASLVVQHLVLKWQIFTLDNATWSLVPEVRISLIFPILVLCATRAATTSLYAGMILYVIAGHLMQYEPGPVVTDLSVTIRFVPFFLMGIWLAIHLEKVRGWARCISAGARLAGWLAALALIILPESLSGADIAYGAAACTIIVLSLSSDRARRALESRPLQWLGRISYSLYLLHLVVILSMVHLLSGHIGLPIILAAVVPLSLGAAHVMYYCVEAPSMFLGRYLLSRPRPAPVIQAAEFPEPRAAPGFAVHIPPDALTGLIDESPSEGFVPVAHSLRVHR